MTISPKIAILIGGVILLIASVLMLQSPSTTPSTSLLSNTKTSPKTNETKNISPETDDNPAEAIVADLIAVAEAEQASFNEETGDVNLIDSDSGDLNSLLNIYDANQF